MHARYGRIITFFYQNTCPISRQFNLYCDDNLQIYVHKALDQYWFFLLGEPEVPNAKNYALGVILSLKILIQIMQAFG